MALPLTSVPVGASSPLWGLWASPPDRPAQLALGLAVFLAIVAVVPRGPRWLAGTLDFTGVIDFVHLRRFLTVASFAAAFLSLGYIASYLHGGPRAPEATALWLQGRALSHGRLSWASPDPTASFRATQVIFTAPDRLAGVGAPGYPLLLAAAFLVGAPMLVGPLLAASLVVVTWMLARELARRAPADAGIDAESVGRIAAGLSIVCVALRYETADARPHGLAAVAMASAVLAALRGARLSLPRAFLAAGFAVGVVLGAAPASTFGVGVAVAVLALRTGSEVRGRAVAYAAAGLLPGLLLLLLANRAATGHALSLAACHDAATRIAAAPSGVKATALLVLGQLRAHLASVTNLEPLAALALLAVFGRARSTGTRVAALVILAQLVAALVSIGRAGAATGHGPGLSDVLPLEHALLALAVVATFPRRTAAAAILTFALSLAGFALHTSHDHAELSKEDGGRPAYEPDVAREANVTHGLLFFDDDRGYALASDPGVLASHGIQAARMRGDDHDRLLYDLLGHPPIHRYVPGADAASINVWTPANAGSDTWRFEAESDWPPVDVKGGQAQIVDCTGMCPPDGKALALDPTGGGEATMVLELPVPRGPTPPTRLSWTVVPRVFVRGGAGQGSLTLSKQPGGPPLAEWSWTDATNGPACVELDGKALELVPDERQAWLRVTARGGPVALDRTTLRPR